MRKAKPIAESTILAAATAAGLKCGRTADETRTLIVLVTCPRCWGTGSYSRCERYQSRCFECDVASGGKLIGQVWINGAKWYRAQKRREAAERRAEREAVKAAHALAVSRARECYELGRAAGFVSRDDLVTATREHIARQKAQAEAARLARHRWFGTVGDKIELRVVLDKVIRGGDRFNRWVLSIFRELETGSTLVWWNSTGEEEGQDMTIRATVKEHGTRDGKKQTVLTRVKVIA
jgi:hypothetical protein